MPDQAPRAALDAAARAALASLRARELLSFRAQPGQPKPAWRATPMGRAVHDSALPTRAGEALYKVCCTRSSQSGYALPYDPRQHLMLRPYGRTDCYV